MFIIIFKYPLNLIFVEVKEMNKEARITLHVGIFVLVAIFFLLIYFVAAAPDVNSTFGTVNLGGYTGSLAVNISSGSIRLQVTPSSSNSTVWTTQYRVI